MLNASSRVIKYVLFVFNLVFVVSVVVYLKYFLFIKVIKFSFAVMMQFFTMNKANVHVYAIA